MSLGWEVTADDIAYVLRQHGIDADAEDVFDEHFVGDEEHCGRVEEAVLACTDFDDQIYAALDEIAEILTEVGVIPSEQTPE